MVLVGGKVPLAGEGVTVYNNSAFRTLRIGMGVLWKSAVARRFLDERIRKQRFSATASSPLEPGDGVLALDFRARDSRKHHSLRSTCRCHHRSSVLADTQFAL